jgi:hypothetical protein
MKQTNKNIKQNPLKQNENLNDKSGFCFHHHDDVFQFNTIGKCTTHTTNGKGKWKYAQFNQ